MKKIMLVAFLILSLTLASCSKGQNKQQNSQPQQPQSQEQTTQPDSNKAQAPDFELTSVSGKKVKLSDLKGKTVVMNFFATWCPYCKVELPGFINTMEEYNKKGADVVFLIIDVDEDRGTIENFLKSRNYNVDPLIDVGGNVFSQYTIRGGIPMTAIAGKDGSLAARHEGYMDEATLKAYIEDAMK